MRFDNEQSKILSLPASVTKTVDTRGLMQQIGKQDAEGHPLRIEDIQVDEFEVSLWSAGIEALIKTRNHLIRFGSTQPEADALTERAENKWLADTQKGPGCFIVHNYSWKPSDQADGGQLSINCPAVDYHLGQVGINDNRGRFIDDGPQAASYRVIDGSGGADGGWRHAELQQEGEPFDDGSSQISAGQSINPLFGGLDEDIQALIHDAIEAAQDVGVPSVTIRIREIKTRRIEFESRG